MYSYKLKIENIMNGIFIQLPGPCSRGGTFGCWWVKNFSVGIFDRAPSTARSNIMQVTFSGQKHIGRINILVKSSNRPRAFLPIF